MSTSHSEIARSINLEVPLEHTHDINIPGSLFMFGRVDGRKLDSGDLMFHVAANTDDFVSGIIKGMPMDGAIEMKIKDDVRRSLKSLVTEKLATQFSDDPKQMIYGVSSYYDTRENIAVLAGEGDRLVELIGACYEAYGFKRIPDTGIYIANVEEMAEIMFRADHKHLEQREVYDWVK
jgi:hypothetical protein